MSRIGRAFYAGILVCFGAIVVAGVVAGVWIWAIAALAFGAVFAVSGPYVLGKKWRPEEPKPRSRAVTRRRR